MMTSRSVVRSSDLGGLLSGCCSSGRGLAPRCLQTPPPGDALALRSHFPSIRLGRGLAPPGCRTCSAHDSTAPRWGRPRSRPAVGLSHSPHRLGLRSSTVPARYAVLSSGLATLGGGCGLFLHFTAGRL